MLSAFVSPMGSILHDFHQKWVENHPLLEMNFAWCSPLFRVKKSASQTVETPNPIVTPLADIFIGS